MGSPTIKSGELVALPELTPSSPYFKQGASLRVTGKLREYTVETAIAVISDGSANLKIDTQHLRDLNFRIGSIYQFIGELLVHPDNVNTANSNYACGTAEHDAVLYPFMK